MNIEKVVLELFSRVQSLEEKVAILEERFLTEEDVYENVESFKISKLDYLNKMNHKIKEVLNCDVRKANRKEGGGTVITSNKTGKSYNVKLFVSKSYMPEMLASGWFGVQDKDFENQNINLFVFAVAGFDEKNDHYFIFTRDELVNEFGAYPSDTTEKKHIYLRVDANNRAIEARHGEKDMTLYYESWNKFQNL